MTILKSEQILADSPTSWQDAVDKAVKRFSRTVRHVRSAYVNDFTTVIDEKGVQTWRVNLQITFEVDEPSTSRGRAGAAAGKTASRASGRAPARAAASRTPAPKTMARGSKSRSTKRTTARRMKT